MRTWEHLENFADLSPRLDLMVVDEAHALRNTGTKSFALGSQLGDWTDMLLLNRRLVCENRSLWPRGCSVRLVAGRAGRSVTVLEACAGRVTDPIRGQPPLPLRHSPHAP